MKRALFLPKKKSHLPAVVKIINNFFGFIYFIKKVLINAVGFGGNAVSILLSK